MARCLRRRAPLGSPNKVQCGRDPASQLTYPWPRIGPVPRTEGGIMSRCRLTLTVGLTLLAVVSVSATEQWPQFRGSNAGVAADHPSLPMNDPVR